MSTTMEWQHVITKVENHVKEVMSKNDASHDFAHVHRVRTVALSLAREEGCDNIDVVELAALLHDIQDWKYCGSDQAGVDAAREMLEKYNYDEDRIEQVCYVIDNVGFRSELGKPDIELPIELKIVQDADRLDAIGAIGISRCFTFGGARHRELYDPSVKPILNVTKEQYENLDRKQTSINHFYEKLLLLKDKMKTNSGKKRALQRHEFMVTFLDQFLAEYEGRA